VSPLAFQAFQPILLFLRLKEALKSFHSCSSAPVMGWALDRCGVTGALAPWRADLLLRHCSSNSSWFWLVRLDICRYNSSKVQFKLPSLEKKLCVLHAHARKPGSGGWHQQLTLRGRHERRLTLLRRTLVAGMPAGFGDDIFDMLLRMMQHGGCNFLLLLVGVRICCWRPGWHAT
jgi:hypothetical protein